MNKTSLFSLRSAAVIITAAVLLLLCACAPAASPQPEASVCATAQTPLAEYSFEGDNARTAGYAWPYSAAERSSGRLYAVLERRQSPA